ncbi:M23 family metallopeptidase [Alicyclobacillus tolerans]|uniref:M23 family metallopeptidase n=1 Tax=Alicyclobacillus tolerans TaxID=90970 RepID=UPI003B820E2C
MQWKNVTAWFGSIDNAHHKPHNGIDMAMPTDTPVYSMVSGTVDHVLHEGKKSFGNSVWIREPNGYRVVFGHLDRATVHPGERIHTGDLVGLSGNTGQSTGPHLHVGVMDDHGRWVDPKKYFSAWNWGQLTANKIKNAEEDQVLDLIHDIFLALGEEIMHLIAPVAFILCAISMLFVILGSKKARRWSLYSGLIAGIVYRQGW